MAFLPYVGRTLKNLFSKPATESFPAGERIYPDRYRGHIENDIDKCILCGSCQRNCPSSAIKVNKADFSWEIHPFSCVQCSKCVEVCPVKCLSMVNSFTEPGAEKTSIVNRFSQERFEKEKEKQRLMAEKIAAAKKAAAEKAAAAKAPAQTPAGT
jgi:ech hydrogenase subunit F